MDRRQLQAELKRLGLPATGKTTELRERYNATRGFNDLACQSKTFAERLACFLKEHSAQLVDATKPFLGQATDYELMKAALVCRAKHGKFKGWTSVPSPATPTLAELWSACAKQFKAGDRKAPWPAGDYQTVGDFIDHADAQAWIWSWAFKVNPQTRFQGVDIGKKVLKKLPANNDVSVAWSVWVGFVIPYMQILRVQRSTVPKGAFTFVYRGGGAGAFVTRPSGKTVAVTAFHCFYFGEVDEQGYEIPMTPADIQKAIANKQYLVCNSAGDITVLDAPTLTQFDKEKDCAVVPTKSPVEKAFTSVMSQADLYALTFRYGKRRKHIQLNPKILCVGSPSAINNLGYTCGAAQLPPSGLTRTPGTSDEEWQEELDTRALCVWDGGNYFYSQTGTITKMKSNGTILHTATVWAGMSGGPIVLSDQPNVLVAIHQSFDTDSGASYGFSAGAALESLAS
ncbi:MAG: hypothetical protein ACPGR8_17330 [Limisphaerales bacterium]